VHSVVFGERVGKLETAKVLQDGIVACGNLIRTAIERSGVIQDWRSNVLGA
jgi:hypothetical protein